MSIQVWKEDLGRELYALCEKYRDNRIYLVSPFLSKSVTHELCLLIRQSRARCTVVTRLNLDDCASGANDLDAIREMLDVGISVVAYKGLHTKLYLFGKKEAVIGSSNLTNGGLQKNYELLLHLSDEPETIHQLRDYVAGLCRYGKSISLQDIEASYQKVQEGKFEHRKFKFQTLGDLGENQPRGEQETFYFVDTTETVWLKFVGASGSMKVRKGESKKPWKMPYSEALDSHYIAFPENQRPSGIQKGDIVYIAFLGASADGKSRRTYIVGRGISAGFDPKQEKRAALMGEPQAVEHKEWPVYLALTDVTVFPGKICEAESTKTLWPLENKPSGYAPRGSHLRILESRAIRFLESYSKENFQ